MSHCDSGPCESPGSYLTSRPLRRPFNGSITVDLASFPSLAAGAKTGEEKLQNGTSLTACLKGFVNYIPKLNM